MELIGVLDLGPGLVPDPANRQMQMIDELKRGDVYMNMAWGG